MPRIHPTALISKDAQIAEDAEIGPYVVIDGPVKIGKLVRILGQASLVGYTEIGDACVIHPFAAIGGPPQDHAYKGHRSYCLVGARTVIREGVTIHRGTIPESETIVGTDCTLMAFSHVAHNCQVGDHVVMTNSVLLAGHVEVGHHAVLGGLAAAHQFTRIGEYAMIAGGAELSQDAPPFIMTSGRNVPRGVNRVGLRRNGIAAEDIDELRKLCRLLGGGRPVCQVARELAAEAATPSGKRLIEFVLADSKRGIGWRSARAPVRQKSATGGQRE